MGILFKNDRPTGEAWRECDVCGLEYPESQMNFRRGRFACKEHCDDENLRSEYETFSSKRRVESDFWPEPSK